MRRLALAVAVATALACNNPTPPSEAGPLDTFFYPTGIAVLDHRLFVASSNADLTFSSDTGGSVIGVDPQASPVPVVGSINIQSFAGELGIADRTACPALSGALALVPIRGVDLVYRLGVGADGALSCVDCAIGVGDSERGDPFAIGIACDQATAPGGPIARAYVGYLRASLNQAWITQIDLAKEPGTDGFVQHAAYDYGLVRAFAYDASRRRLYFTHTVTGAQATLDYVDLANGCRIDLAFTAGGCSNGATASGTFPQGLEIEGIALSNENPTDPPSPVRRAYLSARIYDAASAASAGGRVGDFDGLLLVVDLSENATGSLAVDIVDQIPIGYGAGYVRVLPARLPKRDAVAVIAANDGVVWIYDDETGERVALGRDPVTGAPITGEGPFALGVDPVALAGNVARVYVGSFREHFVTPIDVPLDAPATAYIPSSAEDPTKPLRIGGGVLP